MSPPRPILKRSPATAPLESPTKARRAREQGVRFPPSPKLTRMHTTHSPSSYDRSPIVVTPNACALPARGCPGKTYVLGDAPAAQRTGSHPHPRAVQANTGVGLGIQLRGRERERERTGDRDSDPERTPTLAPSHPPPSAAYLPIPALIPDLSSESDESDGFSSPPPLQASFASSTSSSSSSSSAQIPIPIPNIKQQGRQSSYLSFNDHTSMNDHMTLTTPTATPTSTLPPSLSRDEDKARRKRQSRSKRDRDVRERLSQLEIGWESGHGVGHEDGQADDDDEGEEQYTPPAYRPFSSRMAMTSCHLAESDEGCLAGF
ncbi:hypothetical protein GLOTRDRAFT_139787 [Gloeophyllum trabeum ATCC 11539]|uniref:Uncharacterized protein n=1 Tax=Gloeophyllum trabeum (strain ATCC 11539 / FP-39264 / Madison 617) TaxID=670483 RepID=S7Q0Z3_GLOTA|nr:uncharacterized protein GLOTRDRAFT_139787 [Gloeophyllum trabeum ATCC 11539]EPQ53611.1 hypothetical protein GLOTRDRAFT_139787 [Gloeophyllum trabeum ATCC 11539]